MTKPKVKKVQVVTASGPTEIEEVPPEPPEIQPPPLDVPLTEQRISQILNEWDAKVQEREDKKLHSLLDSLIEQMAKTKPETQMASNGNPPRQPQGNGIQEIFGLLKQFGITGDEGGPGTEVERKFAAMLQEGYAKYLSAQMKGFARANGINWHEVES